MGQRGVAVVTGGRDRSPTLLELERVLGCLRKRRAGVLRHGDCRGTDKAVAAWVSARAPDIEVEAWPAEMFGRWPSCGPRQNRAMLDGAWPSSGTLFEPERPRADFLIALRGGVGTADCCSAALGERWLPIEWVEDVDEPRAWNRHHGRAPAPSLYVGRSPDPRRASPLANPFPLELREGESRAEAAEINLRRYKRWLWRHIDPTSKEFSPRVVAELDKITPEYHLVCSCWPRHCHAEVVIAAWRWRRGMKLAESR